jgi:hypothetical protein
VFAARTGAGLVVLLVTLTLVTSFTASTNVPTSDVGTVTSARSIAQLAPLGCSSLGLTVLVQGSGTFSNNQSKALVLGSAGNDTITDTGSGDCIVGGGGTDTVTGTATDLCVTGPTLSVVSPCPTASRSNGVTVTPSSDNYNNYGGQERLAITNTAAISALTITVHVAQTSGITYASQYGSFPTGAVTQSETTAQGALVYTWVLNSGKAIPAGYQGGMVYAQFSGNGSTHAMSGDSWTVTSTSTGVTTTLTGTF